MRRALLLLRPNGLIAIDNTLWSGRVADETAQDGTQTALRALNASCAIDARVTLSVLPIGMD